MSAIDALLRCFADDGVCIRDVYANELAEARTELAALRAAAAAAREAERERCARIADECADELERDRDTIKEVGDLNLTTTTTYSLTLQRDRAREIAAAIRAEVKT